MERKTQLDGLRGIAILMVFTFHAFHAPVLWFGVDLFFVLSGYLITGILLRMKDGRVATGSALRSFYGRRAVRILPPFLLFLLIATPVFHVHWSRIWYWYAFFGANVGVVLGKLPVKAFGPLWSLAVEEQFYFVWPLVVLLSPVKTVKHRALALLVIAPILRAIYTPFVERETISLLSPFRMDILAWGAAIAIYEHEDPSVIHSRHRLALISAVSAGVIFCALSPAHWFRRSEGSMFFNTVGYSLIGFMFAATVFYALGCQKGIAHAFLTFSPLRYQGRISYTFYLYHVALLLLIREHFHSPIWGPVLAFAITGAIAAVSWAFFESPILRLGRGQKPDFWRMRSRRHSSTFNSAQPVVNAED